MSKGEEVPEGAKIVWYCTECGCGYEQCCPMGKRIGWVQDGLQQHGIQEEQKDITKY